MSRGLFTEGSPILMQLAEDGEKTAKKQAEKYGKHLENVDIENAVNDFALRKATTLIQEYSVIAYDLSDIAKVAAEKMEKLSKVFDGSEREKANGYFLHGVGVHDLLLALQVHDPDAEFMPQIRKQIIERIIEEIGTKGIWAFDRGNDDKKLFREMNKKEAKFIVRLKENRNVILCDSGEVYGVDELKCGRYEVFILDDHGYVDRENRYLLIIRKHLKKEQQPIRLLCSLNIRKFSNKKLVILYLKRWGIENGFKRIKSLYKLEDIRLMKFQRIKSLIALIQFVSVISAMLYKKAKKAICFVSLQIKTTYKKFLKQKSRTYNLHSFGVFLKDYFPPPAYDAKIARRRLQPTLFSSIHRKLGEM